MRLRFFLLTAFAVTLTALPAYAQNPDAVAHFKRGKELRDADKCKEAIPEFKESLRLEESIGGFYNLGFCHDKLGNKQDAFEAFTRARDMAKKKNDERLKEIAGARDVLLQTSPHVTLTLPETLPAGLTIKVDGRVIPTSYYSPGETVIFTDKGGSHVLNVTAPGYEDFTYTITDDRAVPYIPQRPPDRTPKPVRQEGGWMWQHWAGLGAVVVGAGLGVWSLASYLGYDVKRRRALRNFEQACQPAGDPDPKCANAEQQALRDRFRGEYDANEADAEDSAPIWIGVGGFGGLMVIGGVALMIFAPIGGSPSNTVTVGSAKLQFVPQVGPTTQGLGLVGTF